MDEITLRFPHLAEQIYGELDNQSLVKCKEVSLSWYHFLNNNKDSNVRVIKEYTNCSDALIKKLAKNKEDVTQIACDLHQIFEIFRREITQSILAYGSPGIWMSSPLHVAAESGYLNACRLIMENIKDKNPLRICNKKLFIVNVHKSMRTTPLHLAALNGHFNICETILENIGGKIPTDEDDVTPLHYAAQNGHILICQMFMEKIKGQNPKTIHGMTPLHFAAANGHLKLCKLITEAIEAPMTKDRWGRTPLDVAKHFYHFHVEKYLEEVSGAKKQDLAVSTCRRQCCQSIHKYDNEKIEVKEEAILADMFSFSNIHKEEEARDLKNIVIYLDNKEMIEPIDMSALPEEDSEEVLYISDDSDDEQPQEQPAAKKLKTWHLHSEEDLYISDDSDDEQPLEQPAAKKLKTCHLH